MNSKIGVATADDVEKRLLDHIGVKTEDLPRVYILVCAPPGDAIICLWHVGHQKLPPQAQDGGLRLCRHHQGAPESHCAHAIMPRRLPAMTCCPAS